MHAKRLEKHGDTADRPRHKKGAESPGWIGGAVRYVGAHMRVNAAKGKASAHVCSCGKQAQHWAYDHLDPDEKIGISTNYPVLFSPDPDHYFPLCALCHKKWDLSVLSWFTGLTG